MRGRSLAAVLALPVRIHGIQLGFAVDALVDPGADRLLGFEIACGDGARRFLPFSVAELRADEIAIESALMLIDERDLAFYRGHSRELGQCGYAEPWLDDDGGLHEALSAA